MSLYSDFLQLFVALLYKPTLIDNNASNIFIRYSCLGAADKNCLLGARIYHKKIPKAWQPPTSAFNKIIEKFDEDENIAYPKRNVRSKVTTEENELMVLINDKENKKKRAYFAR